jgi:heptosyltransferase II
MKLAVFLPNWIGDTVMATPTLRALRTGLSRHVRLVGISRPGPAALLKEQPWLDAQIVYKPKSQLPQLNRRQLVARLRQEQFDAAILLTNSLSTAMIAALARIPRRIGYACGGRSLLLTDRIAVPKSHGHLIPTPAIDYYLKLAEYMGCPSVDRQMSLTIGDEWNDKVESVWESVGFDSNNQTVVINNHVATSAIRLWPTDRVIQLAKKLVRNPNNQVLLHCGPTEREATRKLVAEANHPRIQSMAEIEDLPMELSIAVLSKADVVVTSDSGARTMAVARNSKVISLFGPTKPEWTSTYNVPEVIVCPERLCDACQKSPTRKNKASSRCRCMYEISVETVYLEVIEQLRPQRFELQNAA